jgi:hypothetical protein
MLPPGDVATATPFAREVGGMGLEATDVSAGANADAADAACAGVAGVAGVAGDAEGGEVGGSDIPEQDDLLRTTTPKTEPNACCFQNSSRQRFCACDAATGSCVALRIAIACWNQPCTPYIFHGVHPCSNPRLRVKVVFSVFGLAESLCPR